MLLKLKKCCAKKEAKWRNAGSLEKLPSEDRQFRVSAAPIAAAEAIFSTLGTTVSCRAALVFSKRDNNLSSFRKVCNYL